MLRCARMKNRTTIDALPDELLASIFWDLARSCGMYRYMYGRDGFLSTSHVCSRWRQIVHSTPQLWTYIITYDTAMVQHCIQRSGAALLEVDLDDCETHAIAAALMEESVLARIRVLRRADSSSSSIEVMKAVVPALLSKPRYNLVALVMPALAGVVVDFDPRLTPALQNLRISAGIRLVLSPHVFSNLRNLKLEYGTSGLNLDLLLASLQGCTLLESLTIHPGDRTELLTSTPNHTLYFPALRELRLILLSGIDAHYFLSSIIFPDTRFSCNISAGLCSTFHETVPWSSNIFSLHVDDDPAIELVLVYYPENHHVSIQFIQGSWAYFLRNFDLRGETLMGAELIEFVAERCASVHVKHLQVVINTQNEEAGDLEAFIRLYEAFPLVQRLRVSCSSSANGAAIRAIGRAASMRQLNHIDAVAVDSVPKLESLVDSMEERFYSGCPVQSVKVDVGSHGLGRGEIIALRRLSDKLRHFVSSVTGVDADDL